VYSICSDDDDDLVMMKSMNREKIGNPGRNLMGLSSKLRERKCCVELKSW
jgi:hypothetical protein